MSLKKKKTWIEVGKCSRKGNRKVGPRGERLLPTHVILKIKRNEHGQAVRFKARIVAGGNHQVQGKDVHGVYAPVIDYCDVLLIQSIAVQRKWKTKHIDYKTAFLNGKLNSEVYVSHPSNLPDELLSDLCYKLLMAL